MQLFPLQCASTGEMVAFYGSGQDMSRVIHGGKLYSVIGDTAVEMEATGEAVVSQDDFQALEQKVLRAVEIVRSEREARAEAEAESAALREQLAQLTTASNAAQEQITTLNAEREAVRLRVEKMMQQIDELL